MAEGEITTFTALTERFNLPLGNYKKPKLLYCSNGGHFLRILPDGKVDGTRDRSDQHSKQTPRGFSAFLPAPMVLSASVSQEGGSWGRRALYLSLFSPGGSPPSSSQHTHWTGYSLYAELGEARCLHPSAWAGVVSLKLVIKITTVQGQSAHCSTAG